MLNTLELVLILLATAVLAVMLWFVLGYAFYCSLYGAAGSLATRLADVQNVSFPVQIPLLVAYFLSFSALFSGDAPSYLRVMAFFPPTALASALRSSLPLTGTTATVSVPSTEVMRVL